MSPTRQINPPTGIERRRRPESLLAGLDLLASGVVVLDDAGRTVFINQAAEQLFELSSRATSVPVEPNWRTPTSAPSTSSSARKASAPPAQWGCV